MISNTFETTAKCTIICTPTFEGVQKVALLDNIGGVDYERVFNEKQKSFKINIPKIGMYSIKTDQPITYIVVPLMYEKLPILPKPDRKPFVDLKLTFKKTSLNGSPARINIRTGVILLNEKFDRMPKYIKRFIIQHEIGHLYYNSEQNCDLYASYVLLKKGYNLSLNTNSLKGSLSNSDLAKQRIKFNYQNMCIVHKK